MSRGCAKFGSNLGDPFVTASHVSGGRLSKRRPARFASREAFGGTAGSNPAVPEKREAGRQNRKELAVDRAAKAESITELSGVFKAANVVVVAHYSGLTVAQMQTLRKQMKQAGAQREGREEPSRQDCTQGHRRCRHCAPAEGADRARLLGRSGGGAEGGRRFRQGERSVRHSRRIDGQDRFGPNGVKALASLPSLDELRAKIVGLIQAPATKIAQLVNAPAAKVARVVQAYASKGARGLTAQASTIQLVRTS